MPGKTNTCAVVGLDGFIVQVEVDISPGLSTQYPTYLRGTGFSL